MAAAENNEVKKGPVLLKFPEPPKTDEEHQAPEQILRAALRMSGKFDELVVLTKDRDNKYQYFATTEAGGYAGLVHFIEKCKLRILDDEADEEEVDTEPPPRLA